MPLVVNQNSLRFTIRSVDQKRVSLVRASRAAVKAAGKVLAKQVKYNVSATDHTLERLAQMDHPYARRHGQIKPIHGTQRLDQGYMRDPRNVVHRRSRAMARSVRSSARQGKGDGIAWDVWFDLSAAEHIRNVLEGTDSMLPRDPLWETAMGAQTIVDMRTAIVKELGARLRSKATIRFGGP